MSRIFGAVRQNGYVVRDIQAAMKHWIEIMGVGPWYYMERVTTDYFRHRGQDSAVEMSIALANSGDLQIELIQQRNDAPSMYREFLDCGREGLQHMSYWTNDYQALYDKALALGYKVPDRRRARALCLFRHGGPSGHGDRDFRHQRHQRPVLRTRAPGRARLGRCKADPRGRWRATVEPGERFPCGPSFETPAFGGPSG